MSKDYNSCLRRQSGKTSAMPNVQLLYLALNREGGEEFDLIRYLFLGANKGVLWFLITSNLA